MTPTPPTQPTQHEGRAHLIALPVVLATAAALIWMAWFGWDTHDQWNPRTRQNQRHGSWQIYGYVVTVGLLAGWCGPLREAFTATVAIPTSTLATVTLLAVLRGSDLEVMTQIGMIVVLLSAWVGIVAGTSQVLRDVHAP